VATFPNEAELGQLADDGANAFRRARRDHKKVFVRVGRGGAARYTRADRLGGAAERNQGADVLGVGHHATFSRLKGFFSDISFTPETTAAILSSGTSLTLALPSPQT